MSRSPWRGWPRGLCADRGAPPTAADRREVAADVGRPIRRLPRATPELKAMDPLWRPVKRWAWSDRPPQSIDPSAADACRYLLEMSPRERLQKAGVFSAGFWLAS